MEKQLKYYLTPEAHDGLASKFSILSSASESRQRHRENNNAIFDGYQVIVDNTTIYHSREGVSHSLNVLIYAYDLTDWIDNRTNSQIKQTIIKPHPIFNTIKEARDYYEENSYADDRSSWSDQPISEVIGWDDEANKAIKSYSRRVYHYRLSKDARYYYASLADFYHMRPPTKGRISTTGKVSAVLEALGIEWLLPPEDFVEILKESPNKNKARPNRASRKGPRRHGNVMGIPFTPDPDKYKPFTASSIMALRQQMIANGEIVEE